MAFLKRLVRALPLLVLSPFLLALSAMALMVTDILRRLWGGPPGPQPAPRPASSSSASVVIPNWNGKDLLEKYLPSVVEALAGNAANEIVVVDNGSTDGSADFVRTRFPQVNLLALPSNLGFGGGSNAGFRAARNQIVVLLNSDMRVAPDFLAPLLEGFRDPEVFAVGCQIFFSDPDKPREETGSRRAGGRMAGCACATASTLRWMTCSPASMAVAAPAPSTAISSLSWADSTRCWNPFTWRIPISVTWRGNAAGKFSISPAAWSTMNTAAPSGRISAKLTFKPF